MRSRWRGVLVGIAVAAVGAAGAGPAQAGGARESGSANTGRAGPGGALVVAWNQELLRILRTPGAQPATVHPTRSFAILQAAVYDAVVSAGHRGRPYLFEVSAPAGASASAAAAQAGHDALKALYPGFAGELDAQLGTELASLPANRSTADGIRVGQLTARFIIAARADDGSDQPNKPIPPGAAPGAYRPTPPGNAPAAFTNWAGVTPWVIGHADRFRPGPPPTLDSRAYARDLNEVEALGKDTSTTRTADQTQVAQFWSAPIQNYWNEITQTLVIHHHADLLTAATVFARVDLALADSVIAFYDAKYHYLRWRPVTAIRNADQDGNLGTTADQTWTPLVNTPADPSYPGAHSVISAAAGSILAATFGDRERLSVTSELLPGTTRTFASLHAAVEEAGLSRLYAGVHTRSDHRAGLLLGAKVGAFVLVDGLR